MEYRYFWIKEAHGFELVKVYRSGGKTNVLYHGCEMEHSSKGIDWNAGIEVFPPTDDMGTKMVCNNCGGQMERSCVDFRRTVCQDCWMIHIWPEPINGDE